MKLIIAGASGFVGRELVRQALEDPRVTSLIALSRSTITPPANLGEGADVAKFQNVIVEDYGSYSDDAKRAFEGVDAVLWTVSVTPSKQRGKTPEEVRRVCLDCALAGLEATYNASGAAAANRRQAEGKPVFRFTYMSGIATERDRGKTPSAPFFMREYAWMRGEAETAVLSFPKTHPGVECQIPKPGAITESGAYLKNAFTYVVGSMFGLPSLDVKECAAAMIEEVITGYSTDTLEHGDLVRVGRGSLERRRKDQAEDEQGKGDGEGKS